MDRLFNLSQLHKNASSEDLKQGSFGIEWEGLRVRENGELSLSPHPEIFGNKLSIKKRKAISTKIMSISAFISTIIKK